MYKKPEMNPLMGFYQDGSVSFTAQIVHKKL